MVCVSCRSCATVSGPFPSFIEDTSLKTASYPTPKIEVLIFFSFFWCFFFFLLFFPYLQWVFTCNLEGFRVACLSCSRGWSSACCTLEGGFLVSWPAPVFPWEPLVEVCGKGSCLECELPLCLDSSEVLYYHASAKSLAAIFLTCLPSSHSLLMVKLSLLHAQQPR